MPNAMRTPKPACWPSSSCGHTQACIVGVYCFDRCEICILHSLMPQHTHAYTPSPESMCHNSLATLTNLQPTEAADETATHSMECYVGCKRCSTSRTCDVGCVTAYTPWLHNTHEVLQVLQPWLQPQEKPVLHCSYQPSSFGWYGLFGR
jgi:hypothetical protein